MADRYRTPDANRQSGFTLIELSIVLVIVGLIVGGILVGQDLIKAAVIRKQIAEIDKIAAGVTTFRIKYNIMPGDACTTAYAIGTYCGNAAGTRDNGVIEDAGGNQGVFGTWYEPAYFWGQMFDVGLYVPSNVICFIDGHPAEPSLISAGTIVNSAAAMVPTTLQGRLWIYLGLYNLTSNCNDNVFNNFQNLSTAGIMAPGEAYLHFPRFP